LENFLQTVKKLKAGVGLANDSGHSLVTQIYSHHQVIQKLFTGKAGHIAEVLQVFAFSGSKESKIKSQRKPNGGVEQLAERVPLDKRIIYKSKRHERLEETESINQNKLKFNCF
jgi:hypothetical protein